MPKSIYLTDEQWSQVAASAVACGFIVGRGRKSEIAKFVVFASEQAANNACTRTGSPSTAQGDPVKSSGSGDEPEPSNSARR